MDWRSDGPLARVLDVTVLLAVLSVLGLCAYGVARLVWRGCG